MLKYIFIKTDEVILQVAEIDVILASRIQRDTLSFWGHE